ncbi:DinB family protein [Bacillus sp. FJAT-27245]|uniref:DinB family protein n=1 Tax=Bacillus sp. FJAT-27245 TaxID=1684144 RepID=UPI0006A7E7A1|nr:DinB family protein [Bacillus sp. FJAT-27245]
MKSSVFMLFEYNWMIREKWFNWCKEISEEELVKERNGGYKGFLHTLFHIVDVEQRWIRGLSHEKPIMYHFTDYNSLNAIINLSNQTKECTSNFLKNYTSIRDSDVLSAVNKIGEKVSHHYIEVLLHLSIHEVHHIGQLSVWARELGKEPVSANLIGLNLFNNN